MDVQQDYTKWTFPVTDFQGFPIHSHFICFFRDNKISLYSIVHHNGQLVIIVIHIWVIGMAIDSAEQDQ